MVSMARRRSVIPFGFFTLLILGVAIFRLLVLNLGAATQADNNGIENPSFRQDFDDEFVVHPQNIHVDSPHFHAVQGQGDASHNGSLIQQLEPVHRKTTPYLLHANTSTFLSQTSCYLDLEQKKQRWINEWLSQQAPLLDAVLLISPSSLLSHAWHNLTFTKTIQESKVTYLVSMVVKHLPNHKMNWNNVTWYCNGEDNPGTVLVSNAPVHLILCQINQVDNETSMGVSLHKVWPSKPSNSTSGYITKYPMIQDFLQCDELEQQEQLSIWNHKVSSAGRVATDPVDAALDSLPNSSNADPSNIAKNATISLAACVIVRNVWQHLPPWIEYHRLMGFDHFWVFVNEPFYGENGTNVHERYERSYVTYLPYDFFWNNHKQHASWYYRKPTFNIFWQEAMQMRCLYNAKRLGVDWITTTDVDEYIVVNESLPVQLLDTGHNSSSGNSTRQHQEGENEFPTLRAYLEYYEKEYDHVSGLVLNSVFFGRHVQLEPKPSFSVSVGTHQRPLLDYVYRTATPKWQRYKVINRVKNAQVAEVHTTLGTGPSLPLQNVYFQHYKKAEKGVAKTPVHDVIRDSRLRDKFLSRVMSEVEKG